ncbi:MAG: LysM peptidoglycan-binding domain-containing protein [Solidesulfovibrio sp. DCME]|uniref:LysM peptidoglycan-binding domain-containing protein n=1 Tax=Solidesulfovibrio sp. DCME TaxID=3447380 RepID=UPI003D0CFA8B
MPWKPRRLALALGAALLAAALVAGCGKYDHLERNMQYVSDDLLRQDAQVAWDSLVAAHGAWRAAGGGREPDNRMFTAYQDAYTQYAIVYNELLDRSDSRAAGRIFLRAPTDELPPPPPGVAVKTPGKAAPVPGPADEPKARDLSDTAPAKPATASTMVAVPPKAVPVARPAGDNPFALPRGEAASPRKAAPREGEAATNPAPGGDRYVVAKGDTLRSIAKRLGVSEKSLMEANGLTDPDKIAAGKSLVVPAR